MVNRLFNLAFGTVVRSLLKQKIRAGSIKAVKAYISAVKVARLALLGLFGIGAFASILVAGILLTVIGAVGLLPIEPQTIAITVLVIGLVLAIAAIVGMVIIFSQKRWLEMSKSYEMMDAVLSPWPGILPPNPLDAMKGRAPHGGLAAFERELQRREQTTRPPLPNAEFESRAAFTYEGSDALTTPPLR